MCVGSVVSTGERQQAVFGRLYVTPKVLFLELLSLILLGYCRNAGCLYSRGTRFEKIKKIPHSTPGTPGLVLNRVLQKLQRIQYLKIVQIIKCQRP